MKKMLGDEARLRHILDSIEAIETYTEGFGIQQFLKDELVKHAVLSRFTVIGEAANHLSDNLKEKYNDIDWKEVVALRNVIVHEYFIVDYSIVWNIIENFIQPLRFIIEKILNNEFNTNK